MLELLGAILTGILSGGATGLLGVLLQRYFDYKKAQQDLEVLKLNLANAKELRQMELEAQERQAQLSAETQQRLAELDTQAREFEAQERSYQASIAGDKATYVDGGTITQLGASASRWQRFVAGLVALMLGSVDFFRGSIRPGVTTYSMVLLTLLLIWVRDLYMRSQLQLTAAQAHELAQQIVGTATYITTTSVVWWFGVRGQSQR